MKLGLKKQSKSNKSARNPRISYDGHRSLPANNYYKPIRPTLSEGGQLKRGEKKLETVARRFQFARMLNFGLLFTMIVLLFFATTLSSSPAIQVPRGSYEYRQQSEYVAHASKILNESLLNRSKVLFRSASFEDKMKQEFPEIDQISAVVPLGGRDLSIALIVASPLAVVSNGSATGVMDNTGTLVSDTSGNESQLFKVRFTSPLDSFEPGDRLLTTNEVELLKLINDEINQPSLLPQFKDVTLKEVLINVTDGQLEARFNGLSYFVRFSAYSDAREQVGAMVLTMRRLQRENTIPTQYIDVRVQGRTFVL